MNMVSLPAIKSKIAALSEPLRIGIGLGLGFAVTLTLVILVMVVGYSYMAKIQADLEQITQVNNVKTELAHTMKFAQRDRSMSLYSLAILTDAFDKDAELRRFDSKGAEWWRAWEKFQAKGMNAQEQALAERINSLAKERNIIVQGAADLAMSQHNQAVYDYISKIAIPGQQKLSDEIDKLLQLQQEQAQLAAASAEESYARARVLLLWLCGLTLLISIVVAAYVLRRVMRQSRELEYKALFDDLTGLPNRSLFFDRLGQAASSYDNEQKPFSIVLVDLDRFKEVNDMQGHHIGDLLLRHVARSLSAMMRRTDTVARLGGDEFVLLLPGATAEAAEAIVNKVLPSLCQRVNLEGVMIDVASSMGIACYPEHDVDITHLLLKADMAMYAAKRANVGYRVYTPEIEAVVARNVERQNDLRYAIEHEQLQLHYQPKISHHTGSIMGVEALVRWNHPVRGLMGPDEFIPLAESCGLIQPLALWVLKAAFQQSVKWHEAGHVFTISINLSTRNLLDGDLPGRVAKLLASYQAKPEWLVFEITESAVMAEPARALETLTRINKMGIQLSLDDFGTGYSSLAYLKKLPVSEIKIDKSFIKDMELDASDTVIVRSTIALGHNLGMKVVAEGVENMEIWDLLTALGCDASQGYYMSRPLTVADLDEWMSHSAWAKAMEKRPASFPGIERRKSMRSSNNN
ncbi:MAG TPA: EAL domain-containing protein [Gallionellaceae bacterium]|nr:EAL domain-containing protein [Gallionellaceae bacterium]